MTSIIQAVACIVDILLILCFLKYIVCLEIKKGKLWIAIIATIISGMVGGLIDFYFVGNAGTFPIKLLLPLCFALIIGKGSLPIRVGNYFLALLLFLSAEILSIFVELFLFKAVVGNAASNNRFLLISILVNATMALFIWRYCSRGKLNVKLSPKEWSLLFFVNIITYLLISAVATESKIILIHAIPQALLKMTINYSAIFLYIFFVISLVNGRIAAHFKAVGQISERHMKEQLKYFSYYKEAQKDTRRFRHDIKNHLLFLQALSAENKINEMKDYIKSLNDRWEDLPQLYSTGNDVVDTIINAKQFMYKEHDIKIEMSGKFDTEIILPPIDLCTVLSNALDNAINANTKLSLSTHRFIDIDIKANRNFYLIMICNPISKKIDIDNNRIISDNLNIDGHGYGLFNMEQALKANGGYLKLSATTDIFILDIVFPR